MKLGASIARFAKGKSKSREAENLPEPPVLTAVVEKPEQAQVRVQAHQSKANTQSAPQPAPAPSRPDLLMTPYLANSDMAVSYADPGQTDEPLIRVNDAFCALTGYSREKCLGTNCRFLQGELSRKSESTAIRTGIQEDHYLITRLLNYRYNGELFDNVLQVGQVRDTGGNTRFLFGLQWDVTRTMHLLGGSSMEADLENRTLTPQLRRLARLANHLVRRSHTLGVGAAGIPMVERLVAMSRPFQFPTTGPLRDRSTLRALLDYLLEPHTGVPGSRLRITGTDGTFDTDIAGPLAIWLHELASASRQYGALSQPTGVIILSWGFPKERGRPMIAFNWHEMKVAALPGAEILEPFVPANLTGGTGARVVQDVVEFSGGRTMTRAWDDKLESTLVLPNEATI